MPANPPANPKAKSPKGKPLGIPMWGWVAAIAGGLVLAYFIARKSRSSTSPEESGTAGQSGSSPLGANDSGAGGGVVAPPPPDIMDLLEKLKALGIIGGTTVGPPGPPGPPGPAGPPGPGNGGGGGGGTQPPPTNPLEIADSFFPNAGFATSPYVAPSGFTVTGPGGPVIDLDTPISTISQIIAPPPSSNPNVLPHGNVVD